ncbi:hypothetical protein tb265_21750 [Gemmatimonadetes bacterium T265]|nr:hypothetical protein tb265_21750 [Gemmatimonadetes bacterium T265]
MCGVTHADILRPFRAAAVRFAGRARALPPPSRPPMSSRASSASPSNGAAAATLDVPAGITPDAASLDPVRAFYERADALYRCAVECCRQHERVAELARRGALNPEQRAARALAALCDDALDELAAGYERAATKARPARGDAAGDACWHAANGLWLAARELTRRHRTSARAATGIGEHGDRSSARLAELALDYDLEASALLLLKQGIETYRKARPNAA